MKTQPVSSDYVSSVSPKLRGGLYIQAVSPGSPAAQAAIQKGDILVGMNVGAQHWETIRADNILYVLRQPETTQTQTALLYVVRRNGIQPCRISLAQIPSATNRSMTANEMPSSANDAKASTSAELPASLIQSLR